MLHSNEIVRLHSRSSVQGLPQEHNVWHEDNVIQQFIHKTAQQCHNRRRTLNPMSRPSTTRGAGTCPAPAPASAWDEYRGSLLKTLLNTTVIKSYNNNITIVLLYT